MERKQGREEALLLGDGPKPGLCQGPNPTAWQGEGEELEEGPGRQSGGCPAPGERQLWGLCSTPTRLTS